MSADLTPTKTLAILESLRTHISPSFVEHRQFPLPKRILDLKDGAIRLVQIRSYGTFEAFGRYATVSHRWGDLKTGLPTRTLKHNIAQHEAGIPFGNLSATFQDAVLVVRALGLRYLWIDSLCIIQDDEADWREQAPKMAQVYGRAQFNIAVHSAKNSSEGFLRNHAATNKLLPPSQHQPYVDLAAGEHTAAGKDLLADSQITCRGWVFQELLLSGTRLHFAGTFFWYEIDFQLLGAHYWNRWLRYPLTWKTIIERYSKTTLTVPTDKLMAIEGIRRGIFPKHEQDFLHGVFLNDIHRSLLWYSVRHKPRLQSQQIPSWSWASLDGEVLFVMQTATQTGCRFVCEAEIEQEPRGLLLCGRVASVTATAASTTAFWRPSIIHYLDRHDPGYGDKDGRLAFQQTPGEPLGIAGSLGSWMKLDNDDGEVDSAAVPGTLCFVEIASVDLDPKVEEEETRQADMNPIIIAEGTRQADLKRREWGCTSSIMLRRRSWPALETPIVEEQSTKAMILWSACIPMFSHSYRCVSPPLRDTRLALERLHQFVKHDPDLSPTWSLPSSHERRRRNSWSSCTSTPVEDANPARLGDMLGHQGFYDEYFAYRELRGQVLPFGAMLRVDEIRQRNLGDIRRQTPRQLIKLKREMQLSDIRQRRAKKGKSHLGLIIAPKPGCPGTYIRVGMGIASENKTLMKRPKEKIILI